MTHNTASPSVFCPSQLPLGISPRAVSSHQVAMDVLADTKQVCRRAGRAWVRNNSGGCARARIRNNSGGIARERIRNKSRTRARARMEKSLDDAFVRMGREANVHRPVRARECEDGVFIHHRDLIESTNEPLFYITIHRTGSEKNS